MLQTLHEIYKTVSFSNNTDLTIDLDNHTVSNTASKDINSEVSLQLVQNLKNTKKLVQEKLMIVLALNGTFENKKNNIIPTILTDNKSLIAQIILDLLTHKEASPTALYNYQEFFGYKKITLLINSNTANINTDKFNHYHKLWIHIKSDNIMNANQEFQKIHDNIYKANKTLEAYFSFTPASKLEISILGHSLDK